MNLRQNDRGDVFYLCDGGTGCSNDDDDILLLLIFLRFQKKCKEKMKIIARLFAKGVGNDDGWTSGEFFRYSWIKY